jgi:hypothetical protein
LTVFTLVGFVLIVIVPDFAAGTRFRQANACVSNLRQIGAAKNQWHSRN